MSNWKYSICYIVANVIRPDVWWPYSQPNVITVSYFIPFSKENIIHVVHYSGIIIHRGDSVIEVWDIRNKNYPVGLYILRSNNQIDRYRKYDLQCLYNYRKIKPIQRMLETPRKKL